MNLLKNIITLLNQKTTKGAALKAKSFEGNSWNGLLHLRNLNLTTQDAVNITSILKEEKDSCTNSITSFILSYNDQLSDEGIISIMNHLPFTVKEIGMVGCNMTDAAGAAVLEWIKNATSLQMVCIEQNNFSNSLKLEFASFKKQNQKVIIIY